MARVDVPTLECDRCLKRTQDTKVMATYIQIERRTIEESEKSDLCPECAGLFFAFMRGAMVEPSSLRAVTE